MTEPTDDKGLTYWIDRLDELQIEAKAHGFMSVVCIYEDDAFADTEGKMVNSRGCGPILMLGIGEFIKMFAKSMLEND